MLVSLTHTLLLTIIPLIFNLYNIVAQELSLISQLPLTLVPVTSPLNRNYPDTFGEPDEKAATRGNGGANDADVYNDGTNDAGARDDGKH